MDEKCIASKYHGDMSDTYEQLRVDTPQWQQEDKIVTRFLAGFPPGTEILDVPVGTGRFLNFYAESEFKVTGVDISQAMLKRAETKAQALTNQISLREGNILALDFADNSFDVAVCIRFMNWMTIADFRSAISELQRVSRHAIVVYVPTYTPLSELGLPSPGGFVRLLRQAKLKFYRLRKRSTSSIHQRKAILQHFSDRNLHVTERKSIDITKRNKDRGYERDIYYLLQIDAQES